MKKFLFAALAVAFFAACSSSDEGTPTIDEGQADARVGLTITFKDAGTRAPDANATAAETAMNTVSVFIFDKNGMNLDIKTLALADFDRTDDTYTLKSTSAIQTKTGQKNIYIGLNLPANFPVVAASNEATFAAEWATTAENLLTKNAGNLTHVAMLSAAKVTPTFVVVAAGDPIPPANTIKVNVDRMVGKVIVQAGTALNLNVATGDGALSALEFNIGQEGTSMFPMAPLTGATPVGTTLSPLYVGQTTYQNVATYDATIQNGLSVYGIEHVYSGTAVAFRHNTTYAIVKAAFTPDASKVIDATGAAATYTAGADFWLLRNPNGAHHFFLSVADARAYAQNVVGIPTADVDDYIVTYRKGYCYYYIFLKTGTDYKFLRNNIYHVSIASAEAIGYPGLGAKTNGGVDPADPGTDPADIDPTRPAEPGDPSGRPGEDGPIDELDTFMTVEITVKPWTVNTMTADLDQ